MARNYILLSNIVNNFLLTRDEDDFGKYANRTKLITYGKECVRTHVSIDLSGSFRTVKLDVNTTLNTVELPNDYIDYSKIGKLDENCQVQVLGVNNKINTAGVNLLDHLGRKLLDSDGIELLSEKDCESQSTGNNGINGLFFNNYTYDFHNGRLFGIGGGNNRRGYYRINRSDNRIELDSNSDWTNGIVLEYLADESKVTDPLIPVEAEEMVRNYILWRTIQNKSNVPVSSKQIAKRDFALSKKQANFRRKMFSKQEVVQQINKYFQLAPKFIKQ